MIHTSNLESTSLTYNREAMTCLKQGQFSDCLALLQRAHALLQSEPDPRLLAITLNNLGCYYKKLGKFQTSLKYLNQALTLEQSQLHDRTNLAGTHLNIAAIRSCLKQHETALQHAISAVTLLHESDVLEPNLETKVTLVVAYYNAGIEYESIRRTEQALEMFRLGLEIALKFFPKHPITQTLKNSLAGNRPTSKIFYFTPLHRHMRTGSVVSRHSSRSPVNLPTIKPKINNSFQARGPKKRQSRPLYAKPGFDHQIYTNLEERIKAMQRSLKEAPPFAKKPSLVNTSVHKDYALKTDSKMQITSQPSEFGKTTPKFGKNQLEIGNTTQDFGKSGCEGDSKRDITRKIQRKSELAGVVEVRVDDNSCNKQATLIQRHVRRFLAQRRFHRQLNAVLTLQSYFKMLVRHTTYKDIYEAVLFIQRVWRAIRL